MKTHILICTLCAILLTACGGGGSATPNTPQPQPEPIPAPDSTTYTGTFVDSPVQGLSYRTATQSGVTNANGEFIYQLGETITFSIGGITFPAVPVTNTITPLTVFKTSDVNHTGVVNMLRLLQSLDQDGDASNGIVISNLARTLAANLNISFTDNTFENLVKNLLMNNNAIHINLVSAEQALLHFQTTLAELGQSNSCGQDHAKVGYSSNFQTIVHGVSGKVTITDNCTLTVENFNYDATAPAVYFYADQNANFLSGNAFTIGEELRNNSSAYTNDSFTIKLPNNKSLDDFAYLSVWCVDVGVNFGDLHFSAP